MTATRPHHAHWPQRLPRELLIPETTLWFNSEVSAARYPHKPLYRFFGRELTFAEFRRQAESVAGWLRSVGVGKGDRVVLLMQNCPQYGIASYGILRADAVVVPVNPMNRAGELGHYITDPGAKVAITSADLAATVVAASEALPAEARLEHLLVTRYADALPARDAIDPAEAPPAAMADWLYAEHPLPAIATRWSDMLALGLPPGPHTAQPDDLAVLPYTSGTTALPKGCMHTHRTLMPNVVGAGLWGHTGAESVSLGVVPMFHVTGMMYALHAPIYVGSTVVLMPRWDRELAGRLISRHRISNWVCIPTMIVDLFGSPNYKRFDLSSLRSVSGGGAAMPQAVAERLQREFDITFFEGYGLTETAAPSHSNPPERAKLQCLGMPIFGVDSRIVDPDTLAELPPGEAGEIVTCGPMLFKGYWGHPEATAQAFIELDGKRFFRTGDLGRIDDDGYFFITDRLKRMINASGFKVWPSEVELLLYRHPAVQEACVIGAHDAYRGETVKAIVVLRPEAKEHTREQDLIDWSRENMAAYKAPRIVEFADALPKSGSGKVMWRLLQERETSSPSLPPSPSGRGQG